MNVFGIIRGFFIVFAAKWSRIVFELFRGSLVSHKDVVLHDFDVDLKETVLAVVKVEMEEQTQSEPGWRVLSSAVVASNRK